MLAAAARPPYLGQVAVPSIEGPITTGSGNIVLMPPSFDLTTVGYA